MKLFLKHNAQYTMHINTVLLKISWVNSNCKIDYLYNHFKNGYYFLLKPHIEMSTVNYWMSLKKFKLFPKTLTCHTTEACTAIFCILLHVAWNLCVVSCFCWRNKGTASSMCTLGWSKERSRNTSLGDRGRGRKPKLLVSYDLWLSS